MLEVEVPIHSFSYSDFWYVKGTFDELRVIEIENWELSIEIDTCGNGDWARE